MTSLRVMPVMQCKAGWMLWFTPKVEPLPRRLCFALTVWSLQLSIRPALAS